MRPIKGSADDRGFISAIEKAYLGELATLPEASDDPELILHSEILERALYKADPTNGGLRFRKLAGAAELESRLLRALTQHLRGHL